MANITTNPQLITSADTNDTELVLAGALVKPGVNGEVIAQITIVSGTFTFNVGASAADSTATFTDGDKLLLTFYPSSQNIHYKAGAGSQTFKIAV